MDNLNNKRRYYFIFDIWFASKRADYDAEGLVYDFIGIIKATMMGFCKSDIEKLIKECLDVLRLALKS